MLLRILIALALAGLAVTTYYGITRWQAARIASRGKTDPVLGRVRPGVPAVVYFWSHDCPPCELVQKPALEQIQGALGPDHIQVVAINALDEEPLARAWGVMSLPTTFVLDAEGCVRHINHGVTRAEQLKRQLAM